jgi:plasmid replication initiation protein
MAGKGNNQHKLLRYMAKSIKIREPNTLIEAGQKLSREELIIWLWSMLKARPVGRNIENYELEKLKKNKEIPILIGEVDLNELRELFPEYFSGRKLKYYKQILKQMESKVAFEVNLSKYIETLEKLNFGYIVEKLELPSPKEVEYYGISVIMSISLLKTGKIQIVYSPYVTPLLLELKTRYTTYDFIQILELSSKYSVVLFRLIKERIGLKQTNFIISFEDLQKLMDTSFKRWVDFNRKVLKPAILEINEKTKYSLEYTTVKSGRKVVGVRFIIKEKPFLPTLSRKLQLIELLKLLVSDFNKIDKKLTLNKLVKALLSLKRVNPSLALWFLLHYPEGEPRVYAWDHIMWVEENPKISYPDKYIESLIKDKNPNLNWLLDQRTKDLIRRDLEKFITEESNTETIKLIAEEIMIKVNQLRDKYRKILGETLGVKSFKEYLNKLIKEKDISKLNEISELVEELLKDQMSEEFEKEL